MFKKRMTLETGRREMRGTTIVQERARARRVMALLGCLFVLTACGGGGGGGVSSGAASAAPTIERVTDGFAGDPSNRKIEMEIACDRRGESVVFRSGATNLVPGKTRFFFDVFLYHAPSARLERVSLTDQGLEPDADCVFPSIDEAGARVAFISEATNLVPGDTNGHPDLFVVDRGSPQSLQRVSVGPQGVEGDGGVSDGSLSGDGRRAVFSSSSSNLVLGDTNGIADVFVRDLDLDLTRRISFAANGGQLTQANVPQGLTVNGPTGSVIHAFVTTNRSGDRVCYISNSPELVSGDNNGLFDVFVTDLTGQTSRVSVAAAQGASADPDGAATFAQISDLGDRVAFVSRATNLVPGDTNGVKDVFVVDLATLTTRRVSISSSGVQADALSTTVTFGRGSSSHLVAFVSLATNLVPNDRNGVADVFLHDLRTGQTTRVSGESPEGNGHCNGVPAVGEGGSLLSFVSRASNITAGDVNNVADVFLRRR